MKEYHCLGMDITYRFESSDEIYTVRHFSVEYQMNKFIDSVLKNIFGDEAPCCYLEATNTKDDVITPRTTFPIIFRRTYKKLFNVEEKESVKKAGLIERVPPPPPYPPPPLRRKKRWRSRSPINRRQRNLHQRNLRQRNPWYYSRRNW